MTVRDLIKELKNYPSTALVMIAVDYRKDKAHSVHIEESAHDEIGGSPQEETVTISN
jgi:hypothetical protein